MEKAEKKLKLSTNSNSTLLPISSLYTFILHTICGLGLALAYWVAHNVYSVSLVNDPTQTLRLIWVIEAPIVILLFSGFRQHPNQCSYIKAVGRGLLGLPAGAIVNALGAIALGAPVGIQHFSKTANWSILMSVFTIVPTASVFGSSWIEWRRIFAHAKLVASVSYICWIINLIVQAKWTNRSVNLSTCTRSCYRCLVWSLANAP
ncbi:uncharacterized protein LOC108193529 isoform X2 [Daucus carota subsp. sativus]|uniref:uncharacterized protein LOC108193529 isoform X2 n=1 Tax=Daucus carota subsp. sativus TaxID=79200 RepID=UPI0030837EF1